MKLSQFEAHPAWATLNAVAETISSLRTADLGTNIDAIQDLEVQVAYLSGRHRARKRLAPSVFPAQLDSLESNLQALHGSITTALANADPTRTQYIQQGQQYMQQAFGIIGAWATVTPTVGEERAEIAVVEELQRRNAEVDSFIQSRIKQLDDSARAVSDQVVSAQAAAAKSEASVAAAAEEAKRAVEAEKARIATVIDEGQKTIAGFEAELQTSLDTWRTELTTGFEAKMEDLRAKEQALLAQSRERFEELRKTTSDYQAIVQADSADRLAKHYEVEARSARKSGWILTAIGGVILLSAALPLLAVVLGWQRGEADWTSIAARAGVSAVCVGAATVAVRMGSGFHRRSDDYKRLAMELRTMGPFLSTVEDSESVDQARLDLVNRTFGQAYAPQADASDVDAVPVSVLQQMLAMVTKAIR